MVKREAEPDNNYVFANTTYTDSGEYPVVPPRAVSKEGAIKDIIVGHWKFVGAGSVINDQGTRKVFIDTNDIVPEKQLAPRDRVAVMRIQQEIAGKAIDGFVVDARYRLPDAHPRLDAEGNQSDAALRRHQPVPALGIVVTDKLTKKPEYIGRPEAESAALQLMQDVDAAREKAKKKQQKKQSVKARQPSRTTETASSSVNDTHLR